MLANSKTLNFKHIFEKNLFLAFSRSYSNFPAIYKKEIFAVNDYLRSKF